MVRESHGEPTFGDGSRGPGGPLRAGLPTGTGWREPHGTGTPGLMPGWGLVRGHAAAPRLPLGGQSLEDFSGLQNSRWQVEAFPSALPSPRHVTSRALGEELPSCPGTSTAPFSAGVWGCCSPISHVPAVPVGAH